ALCGWAASAVSRRTRPHGTWIRHPGDPVGVAAVPVGKQPTGGRHPVGRRTNAGRRHSLSGDRPGRAETDVEVTERRDVPVPEGGTHTQGLIDERASPQNAAVLVLDNG